LGINTWQTEYNNGGQPLPLAHEDMHVATELLA
jgi:hypothetical protein